jgi:hypothetical protein
MNMQPEYMDASTQTTPDTHATPAETVEKQTLANKDADEQAPANPPKKEKDNSWMFENANTERMVLQLGVDDIQESTNEVTIEGGYELLCSYGWKNTDTTDIYGSPVIYVPGTPAALDAREFTPPAPEEISDTEPIRFDPDTNRYWTWTNPPSLTPPAPKKEKPEESFEGL